MGAKIIFDKPPRGSAIIWAFQRSDGGGMLAAWNEEGDLCALGWPPHLEAAQLWMRRCFSQFSLQTSTACSKSHQVWAAVKGPTPGFSIRTWGTPFQESVWRALLNIPPGTTCSYSDLARTLGKPQAHRAVGTAVGANKVGAFIPCHRVIGSDGSMTGYAWGIAKKTELLAAEVA